SSTAATSGSVTLRPGAVMSEVRPVISSGASTSVSQPRAIDSVPEMPAAWPALDYEMWSETCDTLHAHTQVLVKLAVALAPPEPELPHAALRVTARGWETLPLPAPDGSGAFVAALDLRTHEAVVEHSAGEARRVSLGPDRAVGAVTRELLAGVRELAGEGDIDPR